MIERTEAQPWSRDLVVSMAAGIGGVSLLAARPGRNRAERAVATVAGLALLGFAVRRPLSESVRREGNRRRSSSLRFSFVVDRPVEQVFAFCANFENFPSFIGSLKEVRDTGDGRSHWCAATPGGGTMQWDSVTSKFVTNSVIGWHSVPNAAVTAKGVLRFKPEATGTCVQVAIDYAVTDSSLKDAMAVLVLRRRTTSLEAEFRGFQAQMAEGMAERVEAVLPVVAGAPA